MKKILTSYEPIKCDRNLYDSLKSLQHNNSFMIKCRLSLIYVIIKIYILEFRWILSD